MFFTFPVLSSIFSLISLKLKSNNSFGFIIGVIVGVFAEIVSGIVVEVVVGIVVEVVVLSFLKYIL